MTVNTEQWAERMLAGEAAKLLGVGIQTLHFYEQQGLIPHPPRSASGYRLYTPPLMERLHFIRKAQTLGFSLEEIKEIFDLAGKGTSPCGTVQKALAEKLQAVDRRLEELHSFRSELATLIRQAPKLSANEASGQVCAIVEEAPVLDLTSFTTGKFLSSSKERRKTKVN